MSKEADPNGLDAHQPGAKLDAGKPLAGTVLRGFGAIVSDTFFEEPEFVALYLRGADWETIAQAAIPWRLGGIVAVGDYGARKYSANGWKSVENAVERYSEAFGRHLLAHLQGELLDPESGLEHLDHCAWNACACATLEGKK